MHLYCLKILLNIPLCNMTPCLFQLNLSSFYRHIFFSSLIPSFSFFTSSKRTQNLFRTIKHILIVLLMLYIYIFSYSLHFLIYNYLYVLMFSLYYYITMIKFIKYGEYRNNDEIC